MTLAAIGLIIAICVIPVVFNMTFLYLCFKNNYKGKTTIENFVDWVNENFAFPLYIMPVLSTITLAVIAVYIVTYPLQILVRKIYDRIKHIEI